MAMFKDIVHNVAMASLTVGWVCWCATSLGVPFLTAQYIAKLKEKQGLSTVGSDAVIWYTVLGPFSIPIALLEAGIITIDYLRS